MSSYKFDIDYKTLIQKKYFELHKFNYLEKAVNV